MPNWCSCQVTINGPKPIIDEIKEILNSNDRELLNWMRPMPDAQKDNWYNWRCANWGTKWPINNPFVGDDAEEDSITLSFDTAWGPPIEAFRHWAQRDGRVTYRLAYAEPGMAFVGWDSYDGDYFDEECVEHGQDPGRYWELASEEFGMEPDEEPEPLTEWYVDGAKEKGLIK